MTTWLDRLTGRLTMYRTVLAALLLIWATALVLSALGLLARPTHVLLAGLAVAVGTTVAASVLGALVVRARAHLESALITGLILALVLAPGLDTLAGTALAGAVAGASKFLLAWRGRHVANPAALGALVATLTGLGYSGWWAGTPLLLPVTALGALLVLYRTRRLTLGLVFLLVALAVDVVRLGGVDGLGYGLLSSPLVFLAGFMLSEPLTLPPRRWQQLLVAVVVAVLTTVPFQVGPVYSSPQLALVIGNVLAFAFGQRRATVLEFIERRQLGPTTWEFAFRPLRPVRFTPGQYLELTVPHRGDRRGQRRILSISSAPGDLLTVAMRVRDTPSSFKRALLELAPGSRLRASLVAGDFTLPAVGTPVLLVAGGIGITPFASQLAHALARGEERDVVVVYAVPSVDELAYAELLERSGARVIVTAPVMPGRLPAGWTYGGTRVTAELLAAEVPDLARRRALVSGPPALVHGVRAALRRLGVRRVRTDSFAGY